MTNSQGDTIIREDSEPEYCTTLETERMRNIHTTFSWMTKSVIFDHQPYFFPDCFAGTQRRRTYAVLRRLLLNSGMGGNQHDNVSLFPMKVLGILLFFAVFSSLGILVYGNGRCRPCLCRFFSFETLLLLEPLPSFFLPHIHDAYSHLPNLVISLSSSPFILTL